MLESPRSHDERGGLGTSPDVRFSSALRSDLCDPNVSIHLCYIGVGLSSFLWQVRHSYSFQSARPSLNPHSSVLFDCQLSQLLPPGVGYFPYVPAANSV